MSIPIPNQATKQTGSQHSKRRDRSKDLPFGSKRPCHDSNFPHDTEGHVYNKPISNKTDATTDPRHCHLNAASCTLNTSDILAIIIDQLDDPTTLFSLVCATPTARSTFKRYHNSFLRSLLSKLSDIPLSHLTIRSVNGSSGSPRAEIGGLELTMRLRIMKANRAIETLAQVYVKACTASMWATDYHARTVYYLVSGSSRIFTLGTTTVVVEAQRWPCSMNLGHITKAF